MAKLNWFFDFHSHIEVNIGRQPAVMEIASRLVDAGVTEMTMFAKGHCGFTYYPTDLPKCYRHPKMIGDPLGSVVDACTSKGLAALAYISFGVDGHGARMNPLWAKHKANYVPSYSHDHFINTCPYTPYTQESILPQVDEVIARYPVSGFFFDTMSALSPCYCPFCLQAFRETFAFDPPRKPGDAHWGTFGKWRHDRGIALLGDISSFIQDRKPNAIVAFNQIGCPPYPQPMPQGCTRLSLDFATTGPQSRQASRCAAYGSTTPLPADVMPTIFNGGWGDWSPAPDERHHQVAAAIWARNGSAYFGDRLHPDLKLANPSRSVLTSIANFKQQYESHAPSSDATLAPDVLILHGQSMQYKADYSTFSIDEQTHLRPLSGATDILLDAGVNYSVVAEYCLANNFQGVKTIVLPELDAISAESAKTLQQFASTGGQILIVGNVPKVDGQPLSWAGISADESTPWCDHMYLPALDESPEASPVLVRGNHYKTIASEGTQVVSFAIAPLDMRSGISMGWGIAPPCDEPTSSPMLSCTPVGCQGGHVWVLASELFTSYQQQGNWQQVRYAAALMQRVMPRPSVRVNSSHGQIEAVGHQSENHTWVNLINHGGETSCHGDRQWTRTWGPLPRHQITVEIASSQNTSPKSVTLNNAAVPFNFDASDQLLKVPVLVDQAIHTLHVSW